ncbi:nicotinamidase/pyrazinamidase [Tistlia consotensis]|uniref:Nicotinamidase n=1 Tax=Tistlia consotensis USBA 355 TaxID=560819 RepID=A0A1Y6B8J6_9PROT|nr:bifunctional nicotinamidase/pyrazinamidase [Tistlia consotensis]SME89938.1 nicotinamidase/pyrazinamidase [Tistlia consotensis USBA 355]SNR26464.1 nicotinamidase/pyrazinamidase [Tistlia consotensis]
MAAIRPNENDCFVVVDLQVDFMPGGALAVPGGDAVVPLVNGLLPRFAHVVATQDWHPPGHFSFASAQPGRAPFETVQAPYGAQTLWPDHCVQGTPGAAFHRDFRLDRAELILRKGYHPGIDSYSAFYENDRRTPTGLSGYLRERGFRRLFFAGLATDFCVRWSVEDARHEGFEAYVIEEACRAIDLAGSLAEARRAMQAVGAGSLAVADLAA